MIQLSDRTARFLYDVLMQMSLQASSPDFEAIAVIAAEAKRELRAAIEGAATT